jgi:hypothetical protein
LLIISPVAPTPEKSESLIRAVFQMKHESSCKDLLVIVPTIYKIINVDDYRTEDATVDDKLRFGQNCKKYMCTRQSGEHWLWLYNALRVNTPSWWDWDVDCKKYKYRRQSGEHWLCYTMQSVLILQVGRVFDCLEFL